MASKGNSSAGKGDPMQRGTRQLAWAEKRASLGTMAEPVSVTQRLTGQDTAGRSAENPGT